MEIIAVLSQVAAERRILCQKNGILNASSEAYVHHLPDLERLLNSESIPLPTQLQAMRSSEYFTTQQACQ